MTISNPDIVTILRQRIDQCRCLGAVPATRCCGGCEHDSRCLTEIVCLRADLCEAQRERDEARRERDEARRGECSWHRSPLWFARYRGWDCFKEETP